MIYQSKSKHRLYNYNNSEYKEVLDKLKSILIGNRGFTEWKKELGNEFYFVVFLMNMIRY